MALVSVLESTTRKLRWESGGSVTCWVAQVSTSVNSHGVPPHQDSKGNLIISTVGVLTPMPASRSPVTELYQTSNVSNIPTYI